MPTALLAITAMVSPSFADDVTPDDGGDAPAVAETPAPEPAPEPKPAPAPDPAPAPKPDPAPAPDAGPKDEGAPAAEPADEPEAEPETPVEIPADAVPAGNEADEGAGLVKGKVAALEVNLNLDKVVICKYSATPEIGEKAQTVNISSISTLPPDWVPGTFPAFFSDAQNSSVAVRYPEDGENTGSLSKIIDIVCPPYVPPGVLIAPVLTVNDPCGLNNAAYSPVPVTTATYTVQVNPDGSILLTAIGNNVFAGVPPAPALPGTPTFSYPAPTDSGTPCVVTPPTVEQTDPCGLDNAYFADADIPDSTDDYTVSVNDDNTVVTITATDGNVFDGDNPKVYTAVDSDEPCVVAAPAAPTPTDPCGLANAYFADADIPASTDQYIVSVNDAKTVITITATPGNVLPGDNPTVYTAVDSGDPCVIDKPTVTPTDPCGLDNAFFAVDDVPASTDEYTVVVNDDRTVVTITATPGNVFDGDNPAVYTAVDSDEPCIGAAPPEPTPTDPCGLNNAYYAPADIPPSGAKYTVSVNDTSTVITITSTPGNVFEGGLTEIKFTAVDSQEPCVVPPPAEPDVTDDCGPGNAFYTTVPESTDAYVVTVNDAKTEITITATPGNVLNNDGLTELVYTAVDSNEACPIYVACVYPSVDNARSPVVIVPNGVIEIVEQSVALLNGFLGTFPFTYPAGDTTVKILQELAPGQDPADLDAATLCGSTAIGGYCVDKSDKDALDENGKPCVAVDAEVIDALPDTGGPAGWLVPFGAAMVMAGAGLVMLRRPRSS